MQRSCLGSKFVYENECKRSSNNYKFARRHLCRGNSISRNQDLTKDIPCGCFFVKYVCCVEFEPPRQGGSVQGLGDWKAPVCQRQKSAANEA